MELVSYALNAIGFRGDFQMPLFCEKDRLCRKLIRQCHQKATKPRLVCNDIWKRRAATLPDHDLYIAGCPCQPFSSMGRREGLQDSPGRGQLLFRIMKAIATKKPRAFLLENVKGLFSCHPETLRMILGRLRAMGVACMT